MSKKVKISMVKSFICRTPEGKKRLERLYRKPTKAELLQENKYSFQTNY
jgi:hypothetical protein